MDSHRLSSVMLCCALLGCVAEVDAPSIGMPVLELTTTDALVVEVAASDDESLTYSYVWTRNGEVMGQFMGREVPAEATRKGETWTVTVRASNGKATSLGTSASVTILNTPPTLESASLSRTSLTESDEVACTPSGFADVDEDPEFYRTEWLVNGVPVSTFDLLTGASFDRGDSVVCRLTPFDGEAEGPVRESEALVVANAVPQILGVQLSPPVPREGDVVVATVLGVEDADGDPVSQRVTWLVNGEVALEGPELSSALFNRGDSIVASVVVDDGMDTSEAVQTEAVEVANTPPRVDYLELMPAVPTKDAAIDVRITTSDMDGDAVSGRYAWVVNGAAVVPTGDRLLADWFARGDSVAVTVTPSDGTLEGDPATSATVTVGNALPSITAVSLDPSEFAEADTVRCSPTGWSDADGDAAAYSFAWTVNGVVVPGASTDALTGADFSKDELVACSATPNDGFGSGATVASDAVAVSNTAPSISAVDLAPSVIQEASTVTCTPRGWSDDDGDPEGYRYAWRVNGALVSGASGSTLTGADFDRGDSVGCEVTPTDGTDDGTVVSSPVRVAQNTLPTIASVGLSPSTAYETTTLSATLGTVSDADGDTVTVLYSWEVNGSVVASSPTLNGVFFDSGDVVRLSVTPSDGLGIGTAVTSPAVTIQNSTPSITGVSLVPSDVYEATTVVCTPTGWSDADGDAESYRFTWAVDGTTLTGATSATLSGADFDRGETIQCTATPTDGSAVGSPRSSSITLVKNTAPVLASAALTPTEPQEGDTVRVTLGATTDEDGDTVSIAYDWSVNGTSVSTATSLSSSAFDKGDVIGLTVTPSDGLERGTAVVASSVTASNTAPVMTSVSLAPTSPTVADPVVASVTSTDADGDAVTYTYTWLINGVVSPYAGPTLPAKQVDKGDTVAVRVTPNDGDDSGSAMTSGTETVVNALPSITSAVLSSSPSTARESSRLTCTPAGWSDADGDPESYRYRWIVSGRTPSATKSDLTGWAFSRGDYVSCEVTPDDGDGGLGTPVLSNELHIKNTAPTVASVSLSSTSPKKSEGVSAVPSGVADDDGDSVTLSYYWRVNGKTVTSGPTLSGDWFSRGDTIQVFVTPTDGMDVGTTVISSVVTAVNSPPQVIAVGLVPTAPRIADTVIPSVSTTDADGDPVTLTYAWTVDGGAAGTASTLPGSAFAKEQSIALTVTPNDGLDDGIAFASGAITSVNTPPAPPKVALTPSSPSSSDNLVCTITAPGFDADGDSPLTPTFRWEIGGKAYTGATSKTTFAGDTLPASSTSAEQTWICRARMSDGTDLSTEVFDSTRTGTGVFTFKGIDSYDVAGTAVSSAGDIDGDGLGDVLLSSPGAAVGTISNNGAVYLFYGKDLTTTMSPSLSSASYIFHGESSHDRIGDSVVGGLDVDGDDIPDIVIGAINANHGTTSGGTVYVILGKNLGTKKEIDVSDADYILTAESAGDEAGAAVSSAGDVDGDGLDDILVGAARHDLSSGDEGRAYLILGKSLGSTIEISLADADYIFEGTVSNARAGRAVGGGGDVDGDGLDDILVGAPDGGYNGEYSNGRAYLILGKSLGTTQVITLTDADYIFEGKHYDNLGRSVAFAGDMDGDGKSEVLVGGSNGFMTTSTIRSGYVALYMGSSLWTTTEMDWDESDYIFFGEAGGDLLGWSAAGVGDMDGDGLDDFVVSAPKHDTKGSNAGRAYVVAADMLASTWHLKISDAAYFADGALADEEFGHVVRGVGDVDGDGLTDFMVGGWKHGSTKNGQAKLILSAAAL